MIKKNVDLSIIIPINNEEQNIMPLYGELRNSLKQIKNHEIIYVDDGSRDRSFELLNEIAKKNKKIKVIRLRSNYGQTIAIRAGLDVANGEKIITMDGDGQHDPRFIPYFYEKLNVFDVVCNYRLNRKKGSTNFGNFLIKKLFKVKYKDSIGGMKGLRKQVKDEIYLYGNMHRYLPLLAQWKGFKVSEQKIILRKRRAGLSKYNPGKAFKGFIDLLTIKFFVSYSNRPSHIFGSVGLFGLGIGGVSLIYLILRKLFFGIAISSNMPLFLLGIMLTLIGFNFVFFGFLGDMIAYNHLSKNKEKNYIVQEIVN